jgi:hypothetical protein
VVYDGSIAERVGVRMADLGDVQEMKMFGGIGFLASRQHVLRRS